MSDFSGKMNFTRLIEPITRSLHYCMWGLVAFGLGGLLLSLDARAQLESQCGVRSEIIDTLNDRFSEKPVATGLTQGGGVIEVFASGTGSWTMIVTLPTGRACFMAAGESWESYSQMVNGTQISH